ncbi:MAG: tRNA glutamyl-Q synthetase [Bacteroidia bacterium]|nr:tRNA glutamyl-Q synthetase [Bacteroidia bacterium]
MSASKVDLPQGLKFRFAPTPSGYLHLGNAASFLLTWLFARAVNSRLLLRIDDLDRDRFRAEYLSDIFRTIERLGLDYDEGPSGPDDFLKNWSQQKRLPLYMESLEKLRAKDFVYACRCSRASLSSSLACRCRVEKTGKDEPGTAWRFSIKPESEICFFDPLLGERCIKPWSETGDFIVKQKNGYPSYQLSSVVDDCFFEISHLVRGYDLIPSTAVQLMLCPAIGLHQFKDKKFMHHPLLCGTDGSKLSKSGGARALHPETGNTFRPALNAVINDWLGLRLTDETPQQILRLHQSLLAGIALKPNPSL